MSALSVPQGWDVIEPGPEQQWSMVRPAIVNALAQYDIRQSKRKDYNRWALGHYFRALEGIDEEVARGMDLMDALGRAFTGRLHDCVEKAARSAMEKSGNRA